VALALTILHRTGWYGEDGSATFGGHITIDFLTMYGVAVTTENVYSTAVAYDEK
jgi:hypothetical protein